MSEFSRIKVKDQSFSYWTGKVQTARSRPNAEGKKIRMHYFNT